MFEEIVHCNDIEEGGTLCGQEGRITEEEEKVNCWVCSEVLRGN